MSIVKPNLVLNCYHSAVSEKIKLYMHSLTKTYVNHRLIVYRTTFF